MHAKYRCFTVLHSAPKQQYCTKINSYHERIMSDKVDEERMK